MINATSNRFSNDASLARSVAKNLLHFTSAREIQSMSLGGQSMEAKKKETIHMMKKDVMEAVEVLV